MRTPASPHVRQSLAIRAWIGKAEGTGSRVNRRSRPVVHGRPPVCAASDVAIYFVFAAPLHSLHDDDDGDLALADIFIGSDDEASSLFLSHPTSASIMPSAATAIHLLI